MIVILPLMVDHSDWRQTTYAAVMAGVLFALAFGAVLYVAAPPPSEGRSLTTRLTLSSVAIAVLIVLWLQAVRSTDTGEAVPWHTIGLIGLAALSALVFTYFGTAIRRQFPKSEMVRGSVAEDPLHLDIRTVVCRRRFKTPTLPWRRMPHGREPDPWLDSGSNNRPCVCRASDTAHGNRRGDRPLVLLRFLLDQPADLPATAGREELRGVHRCDLSW